MSSSDIITNLSHHFLLATENMEGTFFEDAVIYICTHEDDMTLGLIVNQEMVELNFDQVIQMLNDEIDLGRDQIVKWPTLLAGGPVDIERGLILHSDDYKTPETVELVEGICLTSSAQIVKDIAKGIGPKHYNFCMGYSGWSPHQLEEEIANDNWLVVPASFDVLFETELEERYGAAAEKMGLNLLNYSGFSGEA